MDITQDPYVIARFWSKVDVGRPTECWEWQGARKPVYEYGIFNPRGDSGTVRANRFAYSLVHGKISPNEVVRHSCDNPPCCNPDHLVSGTTAQNVADMHERGRRKYDSRLTASEREEIVRRCADGEKQKNVALQFGITQGYVSRIVNKEKKNGK